MTSFDDERPLAAKIPAEPFVTRSRHNSQFRPSFEVGTPRQSRAASTVRPRANTTGLNFHHKEHHTGFFLANIILMLYDEYKFSKRMSNKLIELRTDCKPSLWQFRHLSALGKANVVLCASTFMFVLYILPISLAVKCILASALAAVTMVPVLSQFFFYAMPVLAWVFFFFSASKIPQTWRPPISVKILPALENILYGDNLSNILAASHNTALDLLAWLPYGIIHFAGPFVVAALVWLFAPPTALRSYAWSFGYMNLFGVIIQQLFPAAPPWYKNLYGLAAANYGMSGSPGGLGRIDKLFGFDMYTTNFSNSPIIFGAFPSLHSACSTMSALWLSYLFPKYRLAFISYVFWLWWATMYLTHHYFFDVTAGSVLAITFFYAVKFTYLPVKRSRYWCRFGYTDLDFFDVHVQDPLDDDVNDDHENELHDINSPPALVTEVVA